MSTQQSTAVTYGIDLGKTWFHVVGLDQAGSPVKRAKLNRASIARFFVNLPAALVGMEACPGSQWLAHQRCLLSDGTAPAALVRHDYLY